MANKVIQEQQSKSASQIDSVKDLGQSEELEPFKMVMNKHSSLQSF